MVYPQKAKPPDILVNLNAAVTVLSIAVGILHVARASIPGGPAVGGIQQTLASTNGSR